MGFVVRSHSGRCVGRVLRDEGSLFSSLDKSRIPFRHESTRGYPAESREGELRLRSGRALVSKETARRVGIERC